MKLQRIMRVFLLALLLQLMNCSTIWASFVFDWYVPQPMTSTEKAITAIQDLRGFLALTADSSITDFSVDPAGMRILASGNGKQASFNLTFSRVERFDQMYDPEGRLYSFLNFQSGPISQMTQVAGREYGRRMVDAVVTLALAQNAVLDPYYDFSITTGSAGYINKVLKQANVSAGAVVHSGLPNVSPMLSDDVITQVSYADQIVPIRDFNEWYAACRQAVNGKPEATIRVKFIRNGTSMDKEIKLLNYAYNFKIDPAEPTKTAGSSKGFGVELRLLDAAALKACGIERSVAFQVVSVAKGSPAERLTLKANDILLAINGVDISSTQQLIDLMGKGPIISVKFWRDGAELISQANLIF